MTHHDGFSMGGNRTAWPMIWETDPKLMKNPQIIKLNSTKELEVGDSITVSKRKIKDGEIDAQLVIQYTILEIIEKRPSSMRNMQYYTLSINRKVTQQQYNPNT